jgi:pimeloyl-ACP methyl ester carboxylesterase
MSAGAAWLPEDVPDRTRLIPTPHGRVFVVDVGPSEVIPGGHAGEASPPPPDPQGPPLVLLHGLFVTHFAFERLIPRLAERRRVIAIDLPGTGDSDHPDPTVGDDYSPAWLAAVVLDAVGALGVDRFDLLGHDYGGAIALWLASAHTDRVRRLVLVDPLALGSSLPLQGTLAIVPALGAEVFKRALRRADVAGFLAQGMSTPELVRDAAVDVYWDRLGREGAREATYAMLGQILGLVRLRERFASVEAPTMVVWGDRDRIVGPEQGERLVELLTQGDARLELIEGCGHNPADERPEALARLVEQHLC